VDVHVETRIGARAGIGDAQVFVTASVQRMPVCAGTRSALGWASAGAVRGESTVVCPAVQPAGAAHCDATCR
jgi:hypothetical protein